MRLAVPAFLLWAVVALLPLCSFPAMGIEIDDVVRQEMDALNKASGFETELSLDEGFGITSSPLSGITFSRSALDKIREQSNVKQLRWVIRFLLAHEKAHQVQFREYTPDEVNTTHADVNRVKECQADILAAKYVGLSVDEGPADEAINKEFSEAIRDILEVSFDIGTEEHGATYPDRQARRTAARLGLARAQLEKLLRLPQEPPFSDSCRHMEIILDVRPNESVLEWSLRLARRIVHFNDAACANLAIKSQQVTYSDRALSAGTAAYDVVYVNTGKRTLKIDMEFQCITGAKEDVEDTSRWQKWTVRNYQVTLGPGERHRVSGQLAWQKTDDSPEPRLVVPVKDDTALLSCTFADH